MSNNGNHLPKTFTIEKFSQWGKSIGNKGTGVGGYDICRTLRLHNGSIALNNSKKRYPSFIIHIPISQSQE